MVREEEENVLYFGYGANASADMMETIVGRRPNGQRGAVNGYELCIQNWEDIPEKVRDILSRYWDSSFRSYSIRHAEKNSVSGNVWLLKRSERDLVDNWEMNGLWYHHAKIDVNVRVDLPLSYTTVIAETEIIDNWNLNTVVYGIGYENFLNSKERMLEVATKVRKEFLQKK
jgi:hypothetical protein